MQDIRAAIRALARRPGFAAIAIATLALGIGGNAAIFSIIDSVLLQPLPYPRADRLVMPWEYNAEVHQKIGFDTLPSSPGDVTDFRTKNTTFEGLAWIRSDRFNLTGAGDPERINGVRVSEDFFTVLGVRPSFGRTFTPEDVKGTRAVLISDRLWRRRFQADAGIIGRVISLNGAPATIIGVLPPWFNFPAEGDLPTGLGFSGEVEIWAADALTPTQQQFRGGKSFTLVGRLKDGIDMVSATADLNAIASEIAREFPASNAGWTVRIRPLREQLVGGVRSALIVLLVAVGFVLLIACANVANLMLVRAAGRHREMCVRLALGAGERRLMRQLLVESLVLAILAGLAGLIVAWVGLRVLLALAPVKLVAFSAAAVDWRVVGFTVAVSALTGLMFGIVPAFQASRANLNEGLRDGTRGTSGSRRAHRTRNALVVVEVALAMVLLVGAVLLLQTFVRLLSVDAGFRPEGVLTMEVALPRTYPGPRAAEFFDHVTTRLTAVPGVQAVAVTSSLPLSGLENLRQITVEGRPRPLPGQEIIADYRVVTAPYFKVMGVPLVGGSTAAGDVVRRSSYSGSHQFDNGRLRLAGGGPRRQANQADQLRSGRVLVYRRRSGRRYAAHWSRQLTSSPGVRRAAGRSGAADGRRAACDGGPARLRNRGPGSGARGRSRPARRSDPHDEGGRHGVCVQPTLHDGPGRHVCDPGLWALARRFVCGRVAFGRRAVT